MDPYVVIEYNGKALRTPAMKDSGKTPFWNYTLDEPFLFGAQTTGNEELKIKCMDDDYGKDDDVGESVIQLSELVTKELTGVSGKWFTLSYGAKKEKAAEIQLDSMFQPK